LPGYNFRPLELEGALGVQQVKRLPMMVEERRKNGKLLQEVLGNHPEIIIQREIGESSWFGFSLIIRPLSELTRKRLVVKLNELGFQCRPIVAGNFARNEVVKYFDSEVHGALKNANHIDQNGLFIGNHHYPIPDVFAALAKL
jgi:CDP-6-deoxy-D-xylo-4-hexulose-3-dehydrase